MVKKYLGPLCLTLAASIWGGMYVVSKMVLAFVPPLELVWLRYGVALLTLGGIVLAARQSWRIRRRDIPLILGIGIIGYFLSIWAQFAGTRLSSAQMGAVITAATPAFMVIFARLILKEPITAKKALSVGMATVGVVLIVGVGDLGNAAQLGGLILGIAALTWALMSVLVKRVPAGYSPLVVTTYAILAALVVMTPLVGFQADPLQLGRALGRPLVLAGVLYLGVVSTAGAFYFWNKGLQLVDAGRAGLYFFFQPLVGTLLGWLFLGEQVGIAFWTGTALILGGVLLVVRE
ncbi:EamA domain-containing membrane protein RarD [Hydrogenispora ethanolica]|uniref:EamA domain-containing membrane protein RarD n=1 Tax=Hydrogenispora ethanolica TaxID=1082276 RepID=A0A4R1SBJ2_HYDET|nr:DMT family transporter [Hydrogenispora ethanolica]TCL76923.1 EamA domain-containing membrane protein RarD [Hydrogenispora ethanolica]